MRAQNAFAADRTSTPQQPVVVDDGLGFLDTGAVAQHAKFLEGPDVGGGRWGSEAVAQGGLQELVGRRPQIGARAGETQPARRAPGASETRVSPGRGKSIRRPGCPPSGGAAKQLRVRRGRAMGFSINRPAKVIQENACPSEGPSAD